MIIRIFYIYLLLCFIFRGTASAQKTSLDVFGGTAYTLYHETLPLPDNFTTTSRFNPHFGAFLNLTFDSAFIIRPGASYLNKAYFFVHELSSGNKDMNARVNQKIESFNFSIDLMYSKPVGVVNVKPFLGASFSLNRNNGGDVIYPNEAEGLFVNPPPSVTVDTKNFMNTFGWRAGLGIQPREFPAFEVEALYGGDLNKYPLNSYSTLLYTGTGTQEYQVNWQGKLSYLSLILIVHLNRLV